jgi:hypothetical protein
MRKQLLTALLAGLASGANVFAGEFTDTKVITTPTRSEDSWQFKVKLLGWVPWLEGDTGLNGTTSHVKLGPDDIVPKLDMAGPVRAEAHKGRLSIIGDLLYGSLSNGKATDTMVKKLDVRVDETIADLGVGWRVIENDRGFLDVVGGARYTNLYDRLTVQPNDERISEVLDDLVAAAEDRLRPLLARELRVLAGGKPTVPTPPLHAGEAAHLAEEIAALKGTVAERKAQIVQLLHDRLDRTVTRTDDWWDPYVGLRGRYNLNSAFYLVAKGDIGGFTVGSDLTWTAEASLGCQLARHFFVDLGFRALGVDYEKDGLLLDYVAYGPQVTLGFSF